MARLSARLCVVYALLGSQACSALHNVQARVLQPQARLAVASTAPRLAHVRMQQDAQDNAAAPANPEAAPAATKDKSLSERAGAVYRFSRPHTIRGTLLACFTGVGRALIESPGFMVLLPALLPRAMLGVLALLLGNLFIVGINQIYDDEIDKVNKPYLPIAAGRLSKSSAWAICVGSAAAGLAIVKAIFSPLIFRLYLFGTTIGGLYSVPPFQLKRFPLAAGLTIATCRGFLLNFGVYYATREALQLPFAWNPAVAFLARFMTVYAAVIAVTKDLPDIEGDRKGGIDTFASRLGTTAVAKGASAVLFLNYLGAIATAALAPAGAFRRAFMMSGHGLAAGWLLLSTQKLLAGRLRGEGVEAQRSSGEVSQQGIKAYYKQIWNLFYLEYAMYPFI